MVGLNFCLIERKMFEEHVTRKILIFIEPQGGARDPDRRLDPDPGYAFQGVKISCVPELKGTHRQPIAYRPGQHCECYVKFSII